MNQTRSVLKLKSGKAMISLCQWDGDSNGEITLLEAQWSLGTCNSINGEKFLNNIAVEATSIYPPTA